MKIEKYISDLLYSVDCVVVVNFGGFILNTKDAVIDHNLSIFKPPRKEVAFNSLLRSDDGVLISYISSKESISYDEAKTKVDNFVKSINDRLEVFEPVYLSKLGLFQMAEDGTISFIAASEVNYNAESYGLSNFLMPVINEGKIILGKEKRALPHGRKVAKYVASIVAILALAFILFTAADYGLQNLYQASIVPNKQLPKQTTTASEDQLIAEVDESIIDTPVEEQIIPEPEVDITEPEPIVTENKTPEVQHQNQKASVQDTAKIVTVNSDFILTKKGLKKPFIIVASCGDYQCARAAVLRLHERGYNKAAIIVNDERYRITISSEILPQDKFDAAYDDALLNVTPQAWIHYY